jgi:hypothetical protein
MFAIQHLSLLIVDIVVVNERLSINVFILKYCGQQKFLKTKNFSQLRHFVGTFCHSSAPSILHRDTKFVKCDTISGVVRIDCIPIRVKYIMYITL